MILKGIQVTLLLMLLHYQREKYKKRLVYDSNDDITSATDVERVRTRRVARSLGGSGKLATDDDDESSNIPSTPPPPPKRKEG